jgi:Icc-related predicted phosphoesterase
MPKEDFKDKELNFNRDVISFFTDYILIEIPEEVPAWIAGGSLRDFLLYGYIKEETDIDIFTNNQENFDILRKEFNQFYIEKEESNTAVTLLGKEDDEKKVQLIKIFYDNPVECINNFDFACCCAYVGYHPTKDKNKRTERVIFDAAEEFYKDNESRTLRVVRLNDSPTATLGRIQKYKAKGFTISDVEKLSIMNAYINGDRQLEEIYEAYEGLKLK